MATIIEKVVAGKDAAKSQEELAAATIAADPTFPSKEFLEERERRALEESELNLPTNALIFPMPGETIATRVVEVSDEEADNTENGSRTVEPQQFAEAIFQTTEAATGPSAVAADGETEEAVDSPDVAATAAPTNQPTVAGTSQVSPAKSSSVPGSGVGSPQSLQPDHEPFTR